MTLLKLIEKIILKQSDNQYKIGIIMEQLKLLLVYCQDDGVTNAAYYDRLKTRQGLMWWSILVSPLTIVFSGIGNLRNCMALAMISYLIRLGNLR
jgi:hypothetical protein